MTFIFVGFKVGGSISATSGNGGTQDEVGTWLLHQGGGAGDDDDDDRSKSRSMTSGGTVGSVMRRTSTAVVGSIVWAETSSTALPSPVSPLKPMHISCFQAWAHSREKENPLSERPSAFGRVREGEEGSSG